MKLMKSMVFRQVAGKLLSKQIDHLFLLLLLLLLLFFFFFFFEGEEPYRSGALSE